MPSSPASDAPASWPNDPRGRLLSAMAAEASERGYAATRVKDLLDRTGVSSRTFYVHFENREACFFATYDAIVADVVELLLGDEPDDSSATVELTLRRLLEHFARWPTHATVLLVEVLSVGPRGVQRNEQTMAMFADRLATCELWRPGHCDSLDRCEIAQAVIGAMLRVMQLRLSNGRAQALPALVPSLVALTTRVVVAA